jgi:MarR family transcriptional regulator, lower aerobic nicotinate degradation pathway regulator
LGVANVWQVITDKPERLTGLTSYLLSQVAKIAKRDVDDLLAAEGLRLRHMAVLAAVDEGPSSQLDLGRRLALDPSDVTATVDDLEQAGLATRSMDPADRRRKVVTLTRAGRTRLDWAERRSREACDALLAVVPERRRAQLHQDLRRILLERERQQTDPE